MRRLFPILTAILALAVVAPEASARDWYVSAERGKGKKGTMEKPARDLSFILKKIEAGDVIHIAEGTYLSKNEAGSDVLKVPVQIIGGYADDFSTRDPWGKHRTVFTGQNPGGEWVQEPRLFIDLSKYRGKDFPKIVVDGLIIDQGPQNRYKGDARQLLVRKGGGGMKPSPDRGALVVSIGKANVADAKFDVEIVNNVVINAAPTQGAVTVRLHKNGTARIANNVILNTTGSGLVVASNWANNDEDASPKVVIENNTIAFAWLYDVMTTSYSGNALKIERYVQPTVRGNILLSADRHTIENHETEFPLALIDNIVALGKQSDYHEVSENTLARIEDVEDEAEMLSDDSEGNSAEQIALPVSAEWAELYAGRVLIDRAEVDEGIEPKEGWQNDLRGMLGLPLQAGNIGEVGGDVWLHQLPLDDALAVANGGPYAGKGARPPQ